MRVLAECYDKAKETLTEHRQTLDKLADFLFEKKQLQVRNLWKYTMKLNQKS